MAATNHRNTHGSNVLVRAFVLCLVVLLPSISASADFRNLQTGDKASRLKLPSASGDLDLPAAGKWQFVVTVGARGKRSDGVAEALPRLVERLAGADWEPVMIVAEVAPGSTLEFEPPAGVPVAFDPDRTWYEALGLFVFPAAGLFDPDGVLRWQRSGFSRDWEDLVEDSLRHYLGLPPRAGADTNAPTLNRNAERLYHLGIGFAKDRRLDDAQLAFDSALAIDPGFAAAHLERADLSRLLGDEIAATASYEAALAVDSTLYRAWTGLGESELQQGAVDRAMASAERALELNPRSIAASQLKARVRIEQAEYAEAEAILTQLLSLKPKNPELRYQLGRVYEATGRNDLALESYREALKLLLDESNF